MTHRIIQKQIGAFDCDIELSPQCEKTAPDEGMDNWMLVSVAFARRQSEFMDGRKDCCPHCYAALCTAAPALFIKEVVLEQAPPHVDVWREGGIPEDGQ